MYYVLCIIGDVFNVLCIMYYRRCVMYYVGLVCIVFLVAMKIAVNSFAYFNRGFNSLILPGSSNFLSKINSSHIALSSASSIDMLIFATKEAFV